MELYIGERMNHTKATFDAIAVGITRRLTVLTLITSENKDNDLTNLSQALQRSGKKSTSKGMYDF